MQETRFIRFKARTRAKSRAKCTGGNFNAVYPSQSGLQACGTTSAARRTPYTCAALEHRTAQQSRPGSPSTNNDGDAPNQSVKQPAVEQPLP
jgi:hypothetical protein